MRITTGHGPDPHPPFPGIEHVTFPSISPRKTAEWLVEYLHAYITKETLDGGKIIVVIGNSAIEFVANSTPPCAEDSHIAIYATNEHNFNAWNEWFEKANLKVIDKGGSPKYKTWQIPGEVGIQVIMREKSLIRAKVDAKYPHVS